MNNQKLLPSAQEYKLKKYRKKKYIYITIFLILSLSIFFIIKMINESDEIDISKIQTILTNAQIKKPLTDSRDYEIIRLENDLVITLISDPKANRSGFSMNTLLGSTNSMVKYPGLTKLLQNLIITKKLLKIIKDNTGKYKFDNNEEISSYYFDINSNGFESALEEFGQILSTAPNYYERKNYAIVDDLKKIYQNEEEEINQNIFLDYLLSVRSHNYDFTFGNGNTGIFKNSQKIIENLKELFNIFYSPQNIKIALISNKSIKQLKELSQKFFGKLQKKDLSTQKICQPIPIENISFHQFIWSKPKNASNERMFKIILYTNEYQFKGISILSYYQYMLDGERPGTLPYILKSKNLIKYMNIYIKKSLKYGNCLVFKMKLTNEGYKFLDNLIVLIMNYFRSISETSNLKETYNDFRVLTQKKFAYMTIDKYSNYLDEITFNMLNISNEKLKNEELSNILFMNYDLEPYDEVKLRHYFFYFTIEYSTMFLQNSEAFTKDHHALCLFSESEQADLKLDYELNEDFGYLYKKVKLLHEGIAQRMNISYHWDRSGFLMKKPNQFLTSLNTISNIEEKEIENVINEERIKMWARKDTTFQVPRIHSYFRFIFPDIRNDETEQYKLNMFYANHIIKDIEMRFEEAKMSGNDIKVSIDENGLNIKVAAYKDIYYKIMNNLFELIFDLKQLTDYNAIDYETKRYRSLEEKTLYYLSSGIKPKVNGRDNFNTKKYLTASSILEFTKYNAKHMYIECLLYGDIDESIIIDMKNLLMKYYDKNSDEIKKRFSEQDNMNKILDYLSYNAEINENRVYVFKLKENFNEEGDNYYISFYQIGKRNNELDILSSLLCHLFNEYDDKYKIDKVYKDNLIYLRSMIKSNILSPLSLSLEYENHIKIFLSKINILNKEEFESAFNHIKRDYLKKDMRLRYKAIKYWYEIYERTFNFKRYNSIEEDLNNTNINDLFIKIKEFITNTFKDKIRKMEIWTYSNNYKGNIEGKPKGAENITILEFSELKYIN